MTNNKDKDIHIADKGMTELDEMLVEFAKCLYGDKEVEVTLTIDECITAAAFLEVYTAKQTLPMRDTIMSVKEKLEKAFMKK